VRVIIAVDEPHGSHLAEGLEAEGLIVVAVVAASALVSAVSDGEIGPGDRRVRGSGASTTRSPTPTPSCWRHRARR